MSARCFPLSLPLRFPHQGLSCNVVVWWLSQGVAKPSLSSLNVYLYLDLICSLSEVLVANLVHPLYSQNFSQALINIYIWILLSMNLFICQVSAPYSKTDLTFVLNRQIFVVRQLPWISTHTFLEKWKVALGFLIIVLTSGSASVYTHYIA